MKARFANGQTLATPRRVYRYFDQAEHARRLLDGRVWVSTIAWCRHADNARAELHESTVRLSLHNAASEDTAENMRRMGIDVPVSRAVNITADKGAFLIAGPADGFLFCTSRLRPTPLLTRQFGPHCVAIVDPKEFMMALGDAIANIVGPVNGCHARLEYVGRNYGAGQLIPQTPPPFVGPQSNESEGEYRFYFALENPRPIKRFEVQAPRVARLCSMV